MQFYKMTPEWKETYRLQVQHYEDLTGQTVTLHLNNGHNQTLTSPSPEIQIDGDIINLTFPTDMVDRLKQEGPTYRLVATDPNQPAGFGDEIILVGRISVE